MKARKTNHLQEEADKIEQIPEEKNDGLDGQDDPVKARKRFLARLRKTWVRITGCMRCCTSIQVEEPSAPCNVNIEDSKDMPFTMLAEVKEEIVEENQNIKPDNEDAEVAVIDSLVEKELEAENQSLLDLIHRQEELYDQFYASQQEILAMNDPIHDLIQIIEDLHTLHYDIEGEEQQDGESKVGADTEGNIKEDGDEELENADSTKESQRASCEMPGPSNISNTDDESSKGKDNEDSKGDDNSISINEKRDKSRSEQKSSSKSNSLEETSEELFQTAKTSQSGSSNYKYVLSSLEEDTPEELQKSIKISQCGSSHDEKPIRNDICLKKLEQPVEERNPTIPLSLYTFNFHKELGEGACGKVYLASDIFHEECVAVKVSNKRSFTNGKNSFAERQILQLSHESPYLIHGLACFHTENFVYYVMELAPRGDLFDFMLNNFPLDTPTIQYIMSEVICGMQFLHNRGIIHRDLKPGNILLSTNGHVKIADFGLALTDVYERTKEKPKGTLSYMAPEMIMGQKYGRGVDYFAIGVMMYKMYTNNLPFCRQNLRRVMNTILYNTPLYPEFLTPDTVSILQELLCKDQDYRLGVVGDIRKHQFFSAINWKDVEARRVEPPAIMTAASVDLNTNQTCDYWEMPESISPKDQKIFKEFSFVCPDWSQYYHPVSDETKSWMA